MKNESWFKENGCNLALKELIPFHDLFMVSDGEPCWGCNISETCPAFSKLNTIRNPSKPKSAEANV